MKLIGSLKSLTIVIFILCLSSCKTQGQSQGGFKKLNSIITVNEVEKIERVLAADNMRGRKTFSPEIELAADFIANEFQSIGLQTLNNSTSYRQEFSMIRLKHYATKASFDNVPVEKGDIVVITCSPNLHLDQNAGYEKIRIKAGANLQSEARKYVRSNKNLMVMVDKSHAANFGRLSLLRSSIFKTDKSIIFVLSDTDPVSYTIDSENGIWEQKLANVVAVLPGRSKKDEYVIFSGHYDHIGIGKPVNGDSIYNGANDDAAGTTAMIMLARAFKKLNNNERTIIFAAFTAEEIGGFGSQYFSRQIDADKAVAMFNIEMIGTESKWGKNSAYITGYEKTNLGEILAKDLEGTGFTFYPDPYVDQNLFYRSDNATLARLGVPAHTISTSKMDSEPNYHKISDHIETLDMNNMTMIIKSIALSARSIIAGTATPTRVKTEDLK
jgi:hypothetical protein